MSQPALKRIPYDDYLAIELETGIRHEWIDGAVFAMAGGSRDHARVTVNVSTDLNNALQAGPCLPSSPDLKVWIAEAQRATYPDCTVVCGPDEVADHDPNAVTNPTLLVEVLSPGTEASDRGDKFADYRRLASLQEVVFVASDRRRVEVYTRQGDGSWVLRESGPGGTAVLASVGARLSVDALYRGVGTSRGSPQEGG